MTAEKLRCIFQSFFFCFLSKVVLFGASWKNWDIVTFLLIYSCHVLIYCHNLLTTLNVRRRRDKVSPSYVWTGSRISHFNCFISALLSLLRHPDQIRPRPRPRRQGWILLTIFWRQNWKEARISAQHLAILEG